MENVASPGRRAFSQEKKEELPAKEDQTAAADRHRQIWGCIVHTGKSTRGKKGMLSPLCFAGGRANKKASSSVENFGAEQKMRERISSRSSST